MCTVNEYVVTVDLRGVNRQDRCHRQSRITDDPRWTGKAVCRRRRPGRHVEPQYGTFSRQVVIGEGL
jgi:hypothetical protein